MARSPPEGSEEASPSPLISSLPEKEMIAFPSLSSPEMKASCFSAVKPLSGWNQWVKWVAPREMAHLLIPSATSLASFPSSGVPSSILASRAS